MLKRLVRLSVIILMFQFFLTSAFTYSFKINEKWNQYTSEHFLIYSPGSIPSKYIREFTRKCEQYYHLIAERMGFTRINYWLGETKGRIKIFLYETKQDYLKNTSLAQWPSGQASIGSNSVNTFYFEKDFFERILPHELTHIVLRKFIGQNTQVPLWFEQGAACSNEKDSVLKYFLLAKGLRGKTGSLAVLELEEFSEEERALPSAFCATAASIIIFLLENYPREYFLQLCRQLRDGAGFYEAMNEVYGIKDASDLNAKLLSFLETKSYQELAQKRGF